jgi:hypothetical protein
MQTSKGNVVLRTHNGLNGDILVLQKFVVPEDGILLPEETYGMNVGTVVSNINQGSHYVNNQADLESIGFNYDSQSLRHGYKLLFLNLLS